MATLVKTWTFDANTETFVFANGSGPPAAGAWTGSDGDPSPGCLGVVDPTGLGGAENWGFGNVKTWETLGVPAGATVNTIQYQVRVIVISATGGNGVVTLAAYLPSINLFPFVQVQSHTTWTTLTGSVLAVPAPIQPSNSLIGAFSNVLQSSSWPDGASYEARIDSISFTIDYTPASACDLTVSPATASITTAQTQQFTASGTSTPVDWTVTGGAANGTVDATGLYTPPGTPGTYTVVATSQADGTCTDSATVTVTLPPNPAQTIDPTHSDTHPGDTVAYTTNNPADWTINGTAAPTGETTSTAAGSLAVAADGLSATYTAPPTPGNYTVDVADQNDAGNTAEAMITNTPDLVNLPDLTRVFTAVIKTAGGVRRLFPASMLRAAKWTDERYGGWAQFSIETNATFAAFADTGIGFGDVVEFWWKGERRYRGEIWSIERSEDDPELVALSGYGIKFRSTKLLVNRSFVYASAVDISRIFADVVSRFVTPVHPTLVIDAQTVGATARQLESTYKMVGESLDDLCQNQGENLAAWGGDTDSNGNDRLYIKPFSTTPDWTITAPGARTTSAKMERQSAEIVNRLTILGGTPRYPNFVYNSSFERPLFTAPDSDNMLPDPSFENGTDWSGSASRKEGGLPEPGGEGQTYSGLWMVETDNPGEYWQVEDDAPAVPLVPGTDYVLVVRALAESGTSTATGRLKVTWLDSGASPISSDQLDIAAVGGTAPALSTNWQTFVLTARAPAGAVGFIVRLEDVSGGTPVAGIHWDDVEMYASTIYQDKWEAALTEDAAFNAWNWAYEDSYDGGYCVYGDVTADEGAGDYAMLRPLGAEPFAVPGGQAYVMSVWTKSPPGVTSNGKLYFKLHEFDKDGNELVIDTITIAAGGGWSAWTQHYNTVTLNAATTRAYLEFVWASATKVLVDGFCLRHQAASNEYVRDGQFVTTIDVENGSLVGLSSGAASSITDNGYMDGAVQVDSITTIEDALSYAAAYFNVHAVSWPQPVIEVRNDDRFFRPGNLARIVGLAGDTLMGSETGLPIVKCNWEYTSSGMLKCLVEMQKELPDLASMLLKKLRVGIGGGATGWTGSSAGSGSGGGGGGTPSAVSITGTTPITVTPSPTTGTGVISHAVSGVTAGTYNKATVDVLGHVTSGTNTRWEPLANGDPGGPALVFTPDGDVIMVEESI